MTLHKVKSLETRDQIASRLPDLQLRDVFFADGNCPHCGDDFGFFFITDYQYSKVDESKHVNGGFICLECGFSNAGAMQSSELPEEYKSDDTQ